MLYTLYTCKDVKMQLYIIQCYNSPDKVTVTRVMQIINYIQKKTNRLKFIPFY